MVGGLRPSSADGTDEPPVSNLGSFSLNESMFRLSELMKLHGVFEQDSALTEKQFVAHFGSILGGDHWTPTQISQLFMKIDANSDGTVDWDEFTNFMFLNANATKDASATTTAAFLPRDDYVAEETPVTTHRARDVFVAIETLPRSGHYLACTHGGVISTFAPTALSAPLHTFKTTRNKSDWVSSMVYLRVSGKVAIASMEAGVVFYDLSTPDKKLVSKLPFSELEHATPLSLSTMVDEGSMRESLFIGDDVGCVTQITFDEPTTWHICDGEIGCHSSPTLDGCKIARTERHTDYITCLEFVADLNCLVSASHDGSIKVVDITRGTLKRDFRQHRGAVYSFAWCKEPKLIASCGLERQVLLWSPYSIRLVGRLVGHTCSIKQVIWNTASYSLLSLGFDGLVRVWDVKNCKCNQVIEDASHERHKVSLLTFDARYKHLITASSALNDWPLHPMVGVQEALQLHEHPICKLLFNPSFQQVVSIDTNAHVVLWNLLDGSMISNFDISDSTITAAALDESGRRLITGSHAGDDVKLWNFSNGSLLTTLKKEKDDHHLDALLHFNRAELDDDAGRMKLPPSLHTQSVHIPRVPRCMASKSNEITSVLSITTSIPFSSGRGFAQTKYLACTGWDRRVYLWNDSNATEYLRRMPEKRATGHTDDVLSLTFCPPKSIATGGVDGCVILWGLNSGDLMHKFQFSSGIEALMYPPKLGLLVGVTTNATLLLINPRHTFVHATVDLRQDDALLEVRVARCDVDGELLFTGLSNGHVQVFRLGCPGRLPLCVENVHAWAAHETSIAALDYVEMGTVLETFLLTTSAESMASIKLWTLGGCLIGLFGHDHWRLDDAKLRDCDYPRSPNVSTCAATLGPPKAIELYQKELRGLRLNAPPAVGDVWFRKDELGLIGAVLTLTSVSRNKGNVEGYDNARVVTEMALSVLFDHAWHRHEFLSGLVGRIFVEDDDGPLFKVASAAYVGSRWQILDTDGGAHTLPAEKDVDPVVLKTPKSASLYRMLPRPCVHFPNAPARKVPATDVPSLPLPKATPRVSNPFAMTARVHMAVHHFKQHRSPRTTAILASRPTQLSDECDAVKLRLPAMHSPTKQDKKGRAATSRPELYPRLDARPVVAIDEAALGDYATLRATLARSPGRPLPRVAALDPPSMR
ncbi:hypothetical protein SDRG_12351 [Saprolegnia diclina VS20]|uniref:EF-hand domain-containing protein n=1 Tax=Saprolegnia diclina (strain VS20) TaxID=1156394 RepID=T0Q8K2_SAPDV|nr:hypothetical protein SDRG_12351 [Saprolegnia diclina VS20]EQC29805.1 hypothetical protein SDRG_12351 [Saprolegnia diclina VS20]|eukprot:XP_008616644.1 hypothetical protein SDRG_12351 [Saprolegnia diclina VS20]